MKNEIPNNPPPQITPTNDGQTPTTITPHVTQEDKTAWLKSLARYAVVWLVAFLFLKLVIPTYDVKGSSMEPTYQISGDRVLTDQVFFKMFNNLSRGDIVVLNRTSNTAQDPLIKRVIGLPGEKIEIRKGVVYINDQALSEDYIKNKATYDYPVTDLAANCYFVMGDNRPVSLDSHSFGCVPKDHILSKVLFRYPWHP